LILLYVEPENTLYQEEYGSTFTLIIIEYNLNELFRLTQKFTAIDLEISNLIWILEWDFPQDWQRIDDANISILLLLFKKMKNISF